MKLSCLAVLCVLILPHTSAAKVVKPCDGAQCAYTWMLSASSTDPTFDGPDPANGVTTFYLWFYCSYEDAGMAAAQFDLCFCENPAGSMYLAFTPVNGFINAGGTQDLLLAVGGCPPGPIVAGHILVLDFGALWGLCPAQDGVMATVDCDPQPSLFCISWVGLDSTPASCDPCGDFFTVAVEARSWSSIKGLYH